MTGTDALLSAAVVAARQSRGRLANALAALADREGAETAGRAIASAVGSLFAVETGGAAVVLDSLRSAMASLQTAMHAIASHPDGDAVAFQVVQATIARTLAVLHPTTRHLEREVEPERRRMDAPVAPAPAPAPRRRPEIVLEDDEDERRQAPRMAIDADIGLHSETNFYAGFSGDISDGGIFVATYDVVPVGTEISVSFVLPDGQQVTAEGVVRWVRQPGAVDDETLPPGMGVAFRGLPPAAREAIRAFQRRREPLFHEDGG